MRSLLLLLLLLPAGLGASYLTPREVGLIRGYWPDYSYAAKKTGVPVAILPAIHYRESSLYKGHYSKHRQKVVKSFGGPFDLDCGGEGAEFVRRIRVHERQVFRLYGGRGGVPRVSHDFRFAALVAAHDLKTKLRCKTWTYDCLVDSVWGYNGRSAWASMKKNSYLWSDPARKTRLIVRYRNMDGELISYVDDRPGVMVIYSEVLNLLKGGK